MINDLTTTIETDALTLHRSPSDTPSPRHPDTSPESLFTIPFEDLESFSRLPEEVRRNVKSLLAAFEHIDSAANKSASCKVQAADFLGRRGFSETRLWTKYHAFMRNPDWRHLVDRAKAGPGWWKTDDTFLPHDFLEHWRFLCESNQRKCRPAWRALIRQWDTWRASSGKDAFHRVPGYTQCPPDCGLGYPPGWSYANLMRYRPTDYELVASRIGRTAAYKHRPKVLSTRCGLKVGEYYLFDDQEYDLKVNFLGRRQRRSVRPLGLNVLDLLSACSFAFGFQPTLVDEITERKQKLRERDMLFFVCHVLTEFGHRSDDTGTTFVVEHGTAAIRSDFEQRIADATGQKVRVERSGMQGDSSYAGLFEGPGRGNPRFKASLESFFNLVRNEMAALPGATGKDRDHCPEPLHGADRYNSQLIAAASALTPERAALMRHPFLEWTEFGTIALDFYRAINGRTEHDIEGWAKCGFIAKEWRLQPQLPWMPMSQYLSLPAPQQSVMEAMFAQQPDLTRVRKLSPMEVFSSHRSELVKLAPHQIPLLLGPDLAEPRKVTDGEFAFEDQDLDSDELRFLATGLRNGETYLTYINPFRPDALIVCTAKNGYLGHYPRRTPDCRNDVESLHRQMGTVAKIEKGLLRDIADRGAKVTRERIAMHKHNANILNESKPATPDEKDRHSRIKALVRKAGNVQDLVGMHNGPASLAASPSKPESLMSDLSQL